jgi:hypothetical protein
MKVKLNHIRIRSHEVFSLQQKIIRVLIVFILGTILGFLAKYVDGSDIGHIGTALGFWILIATIVVSWSRSPKAAALHAFIFFAAMLIVYYIYSMVLFGFFPKYYFIAWGSIALLSPIGGYVVWFSRGIGWLAALCAAFPISLLLVEGYSQVFYALSVPQGFDIFSAVTLGLFDIFSSVLLFIILPKKGLQRLRILLIAAVMFFVIDHIGLSYFVAVMLSLIERLGLS